MSVGKTYKMIIAALLSVAMLISCFPINAVAKTVSETNGAVSDASASDVAADAAPTIIGEVTEKREINRKVFRMSDGTFMSAEYPQAVHYEENGQWKDYNNALTEENGADGEKELANKSSDVKVRFSKKSNGKKLVRVEKDGYKLSWYYVGASKRNAQAQKSEASSDDAAALDNITSTVVYANIYKDVDLEYIVQPTGLKENIILRSKSAQTTFESAYQANGLSPEQVNAREIALKTDSGEVVYTLSAPFMEDAAGARCENISLELEVTGNNTFSVKMLTDTAWLSREERVYPVLVDPFLKTEQNQQAVKTAFVASGQPNECFLATIPDSAGSLFVGNIDGLGQTESYVKFETLPALGVADKVVDARVCLALYECENGLNVYARELTTDWDPMTVTWNNRPACNSIIEDYMVLTPETNTAQYQSVEITDLVRGWYSGEKQNYGLSFSTDKTSFAKAWFFSANYTEHTQVIPIMTVTYRNMTGYESYWSNTSLAAGRSGTASVNNYNGSFIFTQPLLQNGGNLMPVELSLVYNSNASNTPYTLFQDGVQTNYHIFVRYDDENAANGYKYYLNDADGTKHWFYFNGEDTTGKDEDGLGYTFADLNGQPDSNEPGARYRITDVDGNAMFFDSIGNVIRIRNSEGISVTVQYETVDNTVRIKSVKDGAEREYTFSYSESSPGTCVGIVDFAGRSVQFSYYQGLYMWISFSDGKMLEISRDSGNWLINRIKDIDGNSVYVTYGCSPQCRVTEIKSGNDTATLEKYTCVYKQNETAVTDDQGRTLLYQFNDYGQTTGVVSKNDKTAQFLSLEKGNQPGDAKANKLLSQSRAIKSTVNYIENPGFKNSNQGAIGYDALVHKDEELVRVDIDQTMGNLTPNALKITKNISETAWANVSQKVYHLPAGTYTASCYLNIDWAQVHDDNSLMYASVYSADSRLVSRTAIEKISSTDGWERRSVTFEVPEDGSVDMMLGFNGEDWGTVWYDDLQLEQGAGESSVNMIENSNAANLKKYWNNDVIPGKTGNRYWYLYREGNVADRWLGINQTIVTDSKAGDVFSFGAWLKADSLPTKNSVRNAETPEPTFSLILHYYDGNGAWKGCKELEANPDLSDWQFVSGELVLPQDTQKLCLEVAYFNNANTVAVTEAFCYKETFGQTYTYDDNGNVISAVDLAESNAAFAYNGNQMSEMLTPTGSRYLYNYTADSKKRLQNALSSAGQEYTFAYDGKGNLTRSEISARKPATVLEAGKSYFLINAYSGLAMDSFWQGVSGDVTTTYCFTPEVPMQQWQLASTGEENVYTLRATAFSDRYLDVRDGQDVDGTFLQICTPNGSNAQKFMPVRQSDNTFVIYTAVSGYTKVLDGQYNHPNKVVQSQPVKQVTPDIVPSKAGQRWYFYPVEQQTPEKIVSTAAYTENGNDVSAITDARGNTTQYQYNEQNATLTSVTAPDGNVTAYTYDPHTKAVQSVTSGGLTVGYAYENDRLKTVTAGGNVYGFAYDAFGRRTTVKVGNRTLSETAYDTAGRLARQTYGNGAYFTYAYDALDRVTEKKYNGNANSAVSYLYGNTGLVSNVFDYFKNTRTKYVYDLANRLVGAREYAGTQLGGNVLRSSVEYRYEDKTNRLSAIERYSELGTQEIGYVYGSLLNDQNPDAVYTVLQNGTPSLTYAYDPLGRLSERTVVPLNKTAVYSYLAGGHGENSTTTLVNSVTQDGVTTAYTYDASGNITAIKENGVVKESYTYDSLNRLKTVTRDGVTTEYTYAGGNIQSVKVNGETVKTYTYGDSGWRDLLTAYNGQAITYDSIGNPLTYHDGKTFTWTEGRRLSTVTDGENSYTYVYDGDGNRISKTVNGETTEYVLVDGTLVGQISGKNRLVFLYDESGTKYGFVYKGLSYYYNLNLQGDVVGIYDQYGEQVVTYTYDEWGKPLSVSGRLATFIGQLNPIRYRGYYYDTETGLYFLQSRYYDPEVGRFINSDGLVSTGQGVLGYNQFAYCLNNPIRFSDDSGSRCVEDGPNSRWVMVTNSGRVVSSEPRAVSKELSPNQFYNKDGSYSLYDNRRSDPDSVFHEQIFAAKVSSPSISAKDGTATLGSANAYFMTGGWEFEHVDMSLLDIGNAKLSLGVENGTLNVAAMASAWTPSVTVVIWDVNITLSAHVGSVGGKLEVGSGNFEIGVAYGAGVSLSFRR